MLPAGLHCGSRPNSRAVQSNLGLCSSSNSLNTQHLASRPAPQHLQQQQRRASGLAVRCTATPTNKDGATSSPSEQPQPAKKPTPDRMSLSLAPEGNIDLHDPFEESALSSFDAIGSHLDVPVAPPGAVPGYKKNRDAADKEQAPPKGKAEQLNVVRTTGLRRTPLGGGVGNATLRYDLPPPAVAVRNLVERAHFAHLCTIMSKMHHRRAGYPFGTLVDFACDGAGFPILCLSPLGIHTRNLAEDPRASIVVQMPGWTGLANARVTIFGDVYMVPPEQQDLAAEVFNMKQSKDQRDRKWVTGNFAFFRMHRITDIYFVGGFGTLQWVNVQEYIDAQPDDIVLDDPDRTIHVLNDKFGRTLRHVLSVDQLPLQDAHVISVDQLGADIRVRKGPEYSVERIGFKNPVRTLEDAVAEMQHMLA